MPGIILSTLYAATCEVVIIVIFFTDEESVAQKGKKI